MTVTPGELAQVLDALRKSGCLVEVGEVLEDVDAEVAILDMLVARYRAASAMKYEDLSDDNALFVSWLIARAGPRLGLSTEQFEALIASCGDPSIALVTPKWTLARPAPNALYRRVPCLPLYRGEDEDLARAYEGLVEHVEFLRGLSAAATLEMLHTAIPWRIVALVDKLEPETKFGDSIMTRLGRLQSRIVGRHDSPIDRQLWRGLDAGLCARRHALSHLSENSGWTFVRCVDEVWPINTALEATAGISLAVMEAIARSLRDAEPPTGALRSVMKQTEWLDGFTDEEVRE